MFQVKLVRHNVGEGHHGNFYMNYIYYFVKFIYN